MYDIKGAKLSFVGDNAKTEHEKYITNPIDWWRNNQDLTYVLNTDSTKISKF